MRILIAPLLVFFSMRRRHTIYWRDWSSDVCSSDLGWPTRSGRGRRRPPRTREGRRRSRGGSPPASGRTSEIGRASCREKGEISGGAVSLKKKNHSPRGSDHGEISRLHHHYASNPRL